MRARVFCTEPMGSAARGTGGADQRLVQQILRSHRVRRQDPTRYAPFTSPQCSRGTRFSNQPAPRLVGADQHEDFDKWGITIHVKFRQQDSLHQLNAQTQSGGVRTLLPHFIHTHAHAHAHAHATRHTHHRTRTHRSSAHPGALGVDDAVSDIAAGHHRLPLPSGGRDQPGHGPEERAHDLPAGRQLRLSAWTPPVPPHHPHPIHTAHTAHDTRRTTQHTTHATLTTLCWVVADIS
jgi:hypothetical protein